MMKIIVLFFMLLVTFVSAKDEYRYNISLVGMSMDYREYDDNSQILDSEKSDFTQMLGIEFGLAYLLNSSNANYSQFDVSVLLLSGQTEYVGAYLKSGGGYGSLVGKTNNYITNLDIDYLYNIKLDDRLYLFAGAAFGYREWERSLSKNQIETYSWVYLEPKIGMNYLYEQINLQAKAGYKYGVNPTMTATGIDDKFKLGSANTLNVSLSLAYNIAAHSELFCEYIYENQIISKSNIVFASDGNGYVEPDSEANNQYVKFGVSFKY